MIMEIIRTRKAKYIVITTILLSFCIVYLVIGGYYLSALAVAWLSTASVATVVLSIPAGQQAVKETAKTIDKAITVDVTKCETKKCSPCGPPVGTRCHQIDSGHTHNGWDPHYHIWSRGQNPSNCQCFWNRGSGPKGAEQYLPLGIQSCNNYVTWPSS